MKQRLANLDRSDEHIADQYPDIFDGLQKDAGQNAKDAKLTKRYRDWKLSFVYHTEHNSLSIEDFGTKGMNYKSWNEFWQGPWYTHKMDTTESGQRGQGRYLFHYFSKVKLLLAESIDENGVYRFGWGYPGQYDDESKSLTDFIPSIQQLNHQGTRIWIIDIKDDLKSELLNADRFEAYIIASFWEIIRNYNATFTINFDGKGKVVVPPDLPFIDKEKHYQDEEIKGLGKIKNLVFRHCKDEVSPFFQGVAIQRDGMTIKRIPVRAEESFKKRIYGYCNFDENLELELKKCELPNHMDFSNKRVWNHVREYVERRLDSFVLELYPKKEGVYADKKILDEAVRLSNRLISQYIPELAEGNVAPGGTRQTSGGKGPVEHPRKPIRIASFGPNSRKVEYGETLVTDCSVINETSKFIELMLTFKVWHHESSSIKHSSKYSFSLNRQTRKSVDIPLLDFDKKIDQPGKYVAETALETKKGEELDSRRYLFYVHEDPPPGKSFVSRYPLALGKGLPFERWRNLPINQQGEIHIIWDNPEFVRIRERARLKSKKLEGKEIMLYATKCGMDEAVRKLLERRLTEGKLSTDSLKEIKDIHHELIYAANLGVFSNGD